VSGAFKSLNAPGYGAWLAGTSGPVPDKVRYLIHVNLRPKDTAQTAAHNRQAIFLCPSSSGVERRANAACARGESHQKPSFQSCNHSERHWQSAHGMLLYEGQLQSSSS